MSLYLHRCPSTYTSNFLCFPTRILFSTVFELVGCHILVSPEPSHILHSRSSQPFTQIRNRCLKVTLSTTFSYRLLWYLPSLQLLAFGGGRSRKEKRVNYNKSCFREEQRSFSNLVFSFLQRPVGGISLREQNIKYKNQ